MKTTIRTTLAILAVALAWPCAAAWEELRRNDEQRLAIDPATIKSQGGETTFEYLVDFRRTQGEAITGLYRSVVVTSAIRCKDRTISMRASEVFPGNEAKGTSLGIKQSSAEEARFAPVEKGSSDVELFDRVCKGAKPAVKDAKKK